MKILGILLIIFGIGSFAYKGIEYTKREKVAEIGNIQVTADNKERIYLHPIVGGLSIVIGLVLILSAGRRDL